MSRRLSYPDTCLLVPLFIEEKGTETAERAVIEFTKNGEMPLIISELTCLEFHSVVVKYARIGFISKDQARQIIDDFERQCETDFLVLPVQTDNFHAAQRLIREQSSALKSFDALHLAIADDNKCVIITADKQLAAAAATLGMEHYFVS